ncbi:MAG: hypothetical protein QHH24_04970 [Candidatus Bathyarchaeota archaeon]|nr:hypothetical protein [Candidatus Bathyarchaeota archaeon]
MKADGITWLLKQYTPNETACHYFMTGICGRALGPLPLPNTVKFLQFFGAWSKYNIGRVGWHSYLSYPRYIKTSEVIWTDVIFAYSKDGLNSYWDHTFGWGGAVYTNVTALYYLPNIILIG